MEAASASALVGLPPSFSTAAMEVARAELLHRHPCSPARQCSSMGHGGILLGISLNCRGILVQVSAGVRQSRGELRFPASAPLFCSRERKSRALPSGSRFFRPLAGLWPKRLPMPPEKQRAMPHRKLEKSYTNKKA
jgi:hypothetical protein